jgi:hypothetical protein
MSGPLRTKFRKNEAIGQGASADWLPKSKLPVFLALFKKIAIHHGGHDPARYAIGLGGSVISDLHQNRRLSAMNGKRILDEYNRIKSLEKDAAHRTAK